MKVIFAIFLLTVSQVIVNPLFSETKSSAETLPTFDIVKGEKPPEGTAGAYALEFIGKVRESEDFSKLMPLMTERGKKFFSAREFSSLEKIKNYYDYDRIFTVTYRPLKSNPNKFYVALSVATVKGGHVGFSFGIIKTEEGYMVSDRTDRKASKE